MGALFWKLSTLHIFCGKNPSALHPFPYSRFFFPRSADIVRFTTMLSRAKLAPGKLRLLPLIAATYFMVSGASVARLNMVVNLTISADRGKKKREYGKGWRAEGFLPQKMCKVDSFQKSAPIENVIRYNA